MPAPFAHDSKEFVLGLHCWSRDRQTYTAAQGDTSAGWTFYKTQHSQVCLYQWRGDHYIRSYDFHKHVTPEATEAEVEAEAWRLASVLGLNFVSENLEKRTQRVDHTLQEEP